MHIVIIEDEQLMADEMADMIRKIEPDLKSLTILQSVKEAILYFREHPVPDLIFSDIQLGDGLSFEIIAKAGIQVPVIFCTAYDEYALDAFKANGIDYILKPFTLEIIENALKKYQGLKQRLSGNTSTSYEAIVKLFMEREESKQDSILVYFQDKILPVEINTIALFYLENGIIHLLTFQGKTFYPNQTLEELEKRTGKLFFRANRQYLVSRKAVLNASNSFSRKLSINLSIPFDGMIIVSKEKTSLFLKWLTGGN